MFLGGTHMWEDDDGAKWKCLSHQESIRCSAEGKTDEKEPIMNRNILTLTG